MSEIPKIIHYFWIGANDNLVKNRALATWQKQAPTFELKQWDEKILAEIDIPFVHQAYAAKNYAFVSDVVRLYVLAKYGGVYLDTDMYLVGDLTQLLKNRQLVFGFENAKVPFATCFLACVPGQPLIQKLLASYQSVTFDTNNLIPNTKLLAPLVEKNVAYHYTDELQITADQTIAILPPTMLINPSKKSVFVHVGNASWIDKHDLRRILSNWLRRNMYTKQRLAAFLMAYKIGRRTYPYRE